MPSFVLKACAIFRVLCLGLFVMAGISSANADDNRLVLVGLQAPPYFYTDQTGEPRGLLVEAITRASQRSGVPVDLVVSNWPRAQHEVKIGRADLIFPVVFTPDRQDWLEYPDDPVIRFEMMVFARVDPDFAFNGQVETLHGLRIGKIAKGRMHPEFRRLEESGKAEIEGRDTLEQLITAAHHSRLDAFVTPRLMTLWTIEKMQLDTVQAFETPLGVSDIFIGFSRMSQKRAAWQKLLEELESLESYKADYLASLSSGQRNKF